MTTKDEALKLALEALEYIDLCDNDRDFLHPHECFQLDNAIIALHKAIAQALNDATHLAAPAPEDEDLYDLAVKADNGGQP